MSTKNAFSQFGLPDDTAAVEAWRSDLARIIRAYFTRSQLSQTAFAKKLGIKQSVVSRIINSRLGGLSIEFLLRLCVKLETRGYAAWGPSPDDAYATSEASEPTTTVTTFIAPTCLEELPAYLNEWEPSAALVKQMKQGPVKSGSSRHH